MLVGRYDVARGTPAGSAHGGRQSPANCMHAFAPGAAG